MIILVGNFVYVLLLFLVLLIVVVFVLFVVFFMFFEVSVQICYFIFVNFILVIGDVIQGYIEQFVVNFSCMIVVGVFGLIVILLLLMYLIDSVLNIIWCSMCSCFKVYFFVVYWMILIFGLLLVGVSLVISFYLLLLCWVSDLDGVIDNLFCLFLLIFFWVVFWLFYSIVLIIQVCNCDVVIGVLVVVLLFEVGKKVFVFYIIIFLFYQLIYGVILVVLILFVWVYWIWCIVLFGVEIIVIFGEYCKFEIEEIE